MNTLSTRLHKLESRDRKGGYQYLAVIRRPLWDDRLIDAVYPTVERNPHEAIKRQHGESVEALVERAAPSLRPAVLMTLHCGYRVPDIQP